MTNRIVRIVGISAVFFWAGLTAFANNWYVSKSGSDANGGNSWAAAKLTIQAAINAASAGDTVTVGEGVYSAHSETGAVVSLKTRDINYATTKKEVAFKNPCVVYIGKDNITLTSTNRAATVIEGLWDTNGCAGVDGVTKCEGVGTNAVRCIYVTSAGVKIIGFTIRNGATINAYGNGAYVDRTIHGAGIGAGSKIYVYNCEIKNCRAGEGPALSGTGGSQVYAYGCRFTGNKAGGSQQVLYRTHYLKNCLFDNNGRNAGEIDTRVQGSTHVNCTYVNNNVTEISHPYGSAHKYYNCAFLTKPLATDQLQYIFAENCAQVSTDGKSGLEKLNHATNCVFGIKKYVYFSPATEDWTPMAGSALIDAGIDVEEPCEGIVPESWYTLDYLGKQRKFATVDIGCIEAQDFGTKSGVGLEVISLPVKINGTTYATNVHWYGLENDALQKRVTAGWTTGEELFGIQLIDSQIGTDMLLRWPDRNADQGFYLTLPLPGSCDGVKLTPIKSTGTLYVDANYTGTEQDGSEAKPFVNINSAISNATTYSVIKVLPGVYNKGVINGEIARGVAPTLADGYNCRVSIAKSIALRSTEGAEKTIIMGGDEVACVRSSNWDWYAQVQGFTLTGASFTDAIGSAYYVHNDGGDNTFDFVHGRRSRLSDCIVSNNYGYSAIYGGWLERCRFANNRTTAANIAKYTNGSRGTTARFTIASSCIVEGTAEECTDAIYNSIAINCTFKVPNRDTKNQVLRSINMDSRVLNCAFVDGYIDNKRASTVYLGLVRTYEHTAKLSDKTYLTEFPYGCQVFVDADNGDYRPVRESAALNCAEWAGIYHGFETTDINGAPLGYHTQQFNTYPGAIQTSVKCVTVYNDGGRCEVTPLGNTVMNDAGGSVTITVTSDGTHAMYGYVVNGNTNKTSNTTYTYTYKSTDEHAEITPIFSHDLYVNPTKSDSNDGLTAATAKRTLKAIMANALAGDTVHAAEGTYAEGEMTNTVGQMIGERVAIPANVSLIASGSRDKTFITGRWHDEAKKIRAVNENAYYSLRCVQMNAGSYIEGFTIKHGAASGCAKPDYGYYTTSGGGICGVEGPYNDSVTGYAKNCVICECGARLGGAAYGVVLDSCYLYDNNCTSVGGQGYGVKLVNTVVYHSTGPSAIHYHCGVYDSTIYSLGSCQNNEDMVGLRSGSTIDTQYPVKNSIVLITAPSSAQWGCPTNYNWSSCVFKMINNPNFTARYFDTKTCSNIISMNLDECMLDKNNYFAPLEGSPMIDAGDQSLVSDMTQVMSGDFFGNPRVLNGEIDLGAIEYDWRTKYIDSLDYIRLQLVDIGTGVTSENGNIKLTNGNSFTVDFDDVDGIGCLASYTITGDGVLKITDGNGVVIAVVDSESSSYDISGHDKVKFEFEGDGSVVMGKFRSNVGTLMIFK